MSMLQPRDGIVTADPSRTPKAPPLQSPQPVGSVDHFSLLGVPRRYHIDLTELERCYLALSKKHHPDRFVTAEPSERIAALQQSMALNQAYKALKKPISRAEYLLSLAGVAVDDNEKLDPSFLMEVLEWREELQEAKQKGASHVVSELEEKALDRRDETLARVGEQFLRLEQEPGLNKELLNEIKRELILLRYIARYLEAFEDEV